MNPIRIINFTAFLVACAALAFFYFAWKGAGFAIDWRFVSMFAAFCAMGWTIGNEAVLRDRRA